VILRSSLRPALRCSQRVALVAFAMAATALADGSGGGSLGGPAFSNDAEAYLVRTIVNLRELGLKQALGEIDKVLERNPNFRLGHLIRGDLLMARAGQPVAFAATAVNANAVAPLQDEARVRLARYLDAPRVDYLPASLLQLSPSQSHALVVDTSRSRLFVYANDLGRPRYITDFYISLGKNGIEKQREGDQKTPIGVYTVLPAKEKLPDFYGHTAFPLSYPNEWDRLHGRNGHGIWMHGTPSETYSRPPWATDGCVVLTNEDFARLMKYVDVSRTPIVIGQSAQWLDPARWEADREGFVAAFDRWKADWESMDTSRYLANYSLNFRSEHQGLAAWSAHKRKVASGKSWVKVGVNDLSVFAYPGTRDLMMVTFEQDYRSNNMSKRTLKRQFWARESGRWRIVHETVLS